MARPYLNIGQITYATASNLVTIPISAFRVRGTVSPEPGADDPQISITGFSQSITIDLDDNGAYMAEDGVSPKNFTFSADLETSTASTSPTTTYVAPFVDCYISGTAVDGDTFDLGTELGLPPGPGLRNIPIGTTYSAADLINEVLLATFSTALGFTASSPSPGVLRISAPWGAYYNGLNIGNSGSGLLQVGTFGSLTASFAIGSVVTVAEFTGGVTQYNLSLNSPDYFGFSDDDTFSFTVGSTQSGEI